jgi:hypothetical protein
MSEPMSAVEIEDVLSSIRRLVSEDLRPTHRLVSAALENGASKLILTPALRIVSDDRGALPEPADGTDEPSDLRSVLQSIEVGEDAPETAEIVPVFGSVRQQDHTDYPSYTEQDAADVGASDANFLATAMSRINVLASANDNSDMAGQSDRIETVVAAVGAAVGPDEWEPDGGEPAPQAKAWGDTVWNSADATDDVQGHDTTLILTEAVEAEVAENAEAAVEVGDLPEAAIDDDLARDEHDHDERAADVQYDDERAQDAQADTVVAEASAESAVDFGGQDSIIFHDPTAASDEERGFAAPMSRASVVDLDDTAGFVSEDLLREIVRDMIREELQGDLGERITRNVRKLVRAEINRALASRDF